MNIVLLGYGKMGKVIEKIALSRGHNIVARIDVNNRDEFEALTPNQVDVVIEFSHPLAAFDNVKTCIEKGFPVCNCTRTGCKNHQNGFYLSFDQQQSKNNLTNAHASTPFI